jgi:hypothetical protein
MESTVVADTQSDAVDVQPEDDDFELDFDREQLGDVLAVVHRS